MRYFADYIKGKPYQKAVLWENSSPTTAFADQVVTLSDSIKNYDEIKVEYAYATNNSAKQSEYISVSDLLLTANADGKYSFSIGCTTYSYWYVRVIYYTSDTELHISTCCRVSGNSNDNTTIIPLKIIGIKKGLGEEGSKGDSGQFTPTTSAFTEITLPFEPTDIYFYFTYTNASQAIILHYDCVNEKTYQTYGGSTEYDYTSSYVNYIIVEGKKVKYKALGTGYNVLTRYVAIKKV